MSDKTDAALVTEARTDLKAPDNPLRRRLVDALAEAPSIVSQADAVVDIVGPILRTLADRVETLAKGPTADAETWRTAIHAARERAEKAEAEMERLRDALLGAPGTCDEPNHDRRRAVSGGVCQICSWHLGAAATRDALEASHGK
jgi:hypothetical protein